MDRQALPHEPTEHRLYLIWWDAITHSPEASYHCLTSSQPATLFQTPKHLTRRATGPRWPSAMSWTASSHPLLLINVLSLSDVHVPLLIHRSGWPRSRALSPSQTQGHQANMLLCSKPCGQPASSLRAALRATIDPSLPTGPAPKMPTLQPNNQSSEQPKHNTLRRQRGLGPNCLQCTASTPGHLRNEDNPRLTHLAN